MSQTKEIFCVSILPTIISALHDFPIELCNIIYQYRDYKSVDTASIDSNNLWIVSNIKESINRSLDKSAIRINKKDEKPIEINEILHGMDTYNGIQELLYYELRGDLWGRMHEYYIRLSNNGIYLKVSDSTNSRKRNKKTQRSSYVDASRTLQNLFVSKYDYNAFINFQKQLKEK